MKALGLAVKSENTINLPDQMVRAADAAQYEVFAVDGGFLLVPMPTDQPRLDAVLRLARETITAHRRSLEDLAR